MNKLNQWAEKNRAAIAGVMEAVWTVISLGTELITIAVYMTALLLMFLVYNAGPEMTLHQLGMFMQSPMFQNVVAIASVTYLIGNRFICGSPLRRGRSEQAGYAVGRASKTEAPITTE